MSVINKASTLFDEVALRFDPEGTFRREKLAVMIGYGVVSACTLLYAFSSSESLSNELGAYIESNQVNNTGEQWFLLQNKSDYPWENLELNLNDAYTLSHPKPVPPGATFKILVQDFIYNDFIPHTPRIESWKTVSRTSRAGPFAPPDLKPKTLKLVTNNGSFTALFGLPDPPKPSSKPAPAPE